MQGHRTAAARGCSAAALDTTVRFGHALSPIAGKAPRQPFENFASPPLPPPPPRLCAATWPNSLDDYAAAFKAGLKVLVFSGDADATTCPFSSTQVAVMALTELPGAGISANWTSWSVNAQTAGYIERHGAAFTFATVKGAGHEAPGFQPYVTYELVRNFVAGSLDALTAPPPRPARNSRQRATQASVLNQKVAEELERLRRARGT